MRRLLIAVLAAFAVIQSVPSQAAPPPTGLLIQNYQGQLSDGGSFTGTLLIDRMVPEGLNSKLVRVVGKISGTATTIDGTTHQVNEPFSTTAVLTSDTSSNAITAQQATTCNILSLTLGPIYLNLLGLVVTTNQIVIHIFAIQGGGLLGDLLCSLANALATGTPLGSLLGQLNQLLSSILATLML